MPTGKVGGSVYDQSPTPFKPTLAQLAPMHPERLAAIDHLVGQTFTAGPKKNSLIAKQLVGLNLSPEEKQYVSQSSSRRGNKAIAAKGEGLHGLVHHAVPVLARGALDVGAFLSGAGVSQTPLRDAHGKVKIGLDGKPIMVTESTIGLPGLGGLKGVLGDVSKARTVEEALQHATGASKKALVEGHGVRGLGGVGNGAKLRPGELTVGTGGESGALVRAAVKGTKEGVPGAAEMHAAKVDLQHEAKIERVQAAEVASKKAGGGLAGHIAGKQQLQGEYPTIFWNNQLVGLDQGTLNEMVHFIQGHPGLQYFDRTKVIDALDKMTKGETIAPHEIRLLKRTFGEELGGQLSDLTKNGGFKKLAVDVLNVPRSIMASADLSAPMRQGLIAGITHPSLLAKNLGPMIKMAKSEDFYQASMDSIHSDPLYPLMDKGGLALTEIGKDAEHGAAALGAREEPRMSNLAEHVPGRNPISRIYNSTFGKVIRGSDRAYVGFLNKIRSDYFKRLALQAARQGSDLNDEKTLHEIASFVNMTTGRGNVPKIMQDHLATMNVAFFSPRLLASRIEFLASPLLYARANPTVRKEALRAYLSMGAMAVTVLELAKLGGAQVNTDPTNADFAKVKLGNTRIDFLGGNQQLIRLAAQLAEQKITSSTTGKTIALGTGKFGAATSYDIIVKFLQGKLSPVPSLLVDAAKGQDFTGKPVKWNDLSSYQREAASHLIPFLAQDLHDLYTTSGPAGLLAGPLDLFGVGVQSYRATPPKGRSSGGSSDPYTQGSVYDQSPYAGGGSPYTQPATP